MNQKALLFVACALSAAAMATFLLFADGEDTGPLQAAADAPRHELEAAALQADPNDAAAIEASAPPVGETSARDAVADATGKRPIPDGSTWVVLTVVDGATDAPVPGAKVWWYDEKAWELLMPKSSRYGWDPQLQQIWRTPEKIADRVGWHAVTDDKGQAKVSLRENSTVAATHTGKYGQLNLRKNTVTPTGGHRVRLVDDLSLAVRVVDDADQPCGQVAINVSPYDQQQRELGNYRWATLATTGDDGAAVIPHLQQLLKQAKDEQLDLSKATWHVRPILPGDEQRGVPLSLTELPTEPVVLRLGPCGSIKVRATNNGKPITTFERAMLQEDRSGRNDEHTWTMPRTTRVEADGWARFRHVPLGRRFHVMDAQGANLRAAVVGPMNRGQEVEVELRIPDDSLTLTGRIVDARREPVADERFVVQARGPSIRHGGECRTDAEGRFLVTLSKGRKDNRIDEMTFQLHTEAEQQPLRAELPPRTLRPGIEDVGDLVLGEGTLLVAGRLVAGDVAYTKQIGVEVQYREMPTGNKQPRWRSVDNPLVFVDGKGGFKVSGKPGTGQHRLVLHAHEALPTDPIEFRIGDKDLVVTIDPGSPLAASALLPSAIDGDALSATLVPARPVDPQRKNNPRLTAHPESTQEERHDLQWPAVPVGTYALELRLRTKVEPLLRLEAIVVPGPEGGDPRLVDIDLRGLVRKLTVQLLDAEGKPLDDADGMLFAGSQGEDAEWIGQQFWGPKFTTLVTPGPLDLLMCAQGFRPQPVRGNPAGETLDVRLDPWPTVEVSIPNVPQLPKGGEVQVRLVPTAGPTGTVKNQWGSNSRSEYLAANGTASLENGSCKVAIGDGPHRLQVTVEANRRSHELQGVTPTQVLSTDARVVVQISAEQWQQAITAITPPPK